MVVEIFNANVTYSVKQLTADCVDETSVHNGFNVDNDYNIRFRTVYKVASVSVIGYRGSIPTTLLSWRELKLTSSCHERIR